MIVLDENDLEVPYQVTYNDMLIFPTSVKASSTATYTIKPGNPQPVDVISCGRVYPERVDDIAWETTVRLIALMVLHCSNRRKGLRL